MLSTGSGRYRVSKYSINGNQKILEGDGEVARIVNRKSGIERFRYYSRVGRQMINMSSVSAESVFAETYGSLLERAFQESEGIGSILDDANITKPYKDANNGDSKLCQQLMQVAKLIDLRTHHQVRSERDAFYVQLGGFDTHSDVNDVLNSKLEELNQCVALFVAEMKRKGTWESVAIATLSDFGRTLTSNGRGTDTRGQEIRWCSAVASREVRSLGPTLSIFKRATRIRSTSAAVVSSPRCHGRACGSDFASGSASSQSSCPPCYPICTGFLRPRS